jgi:TolB-like protein
VTVRTLVFGIAVVALAAPVVPLGAGPSGPAAQKAAPPTLYPDREIDAGVGKPAALSYAADGRLLAVAGASGVGWWDAQTGTLIKREAAQGVQAVSFSPSGNSVAIGGADGRVQVIDLRVGGAHEVARHAKPVSVVAFQADGRVGASGDAGGVIVLWDPQGAALGTLEDRSNRSAVLFLGFAGSTLLAVHSDMTIVTWDVNGKRAIRRGGLQPGGTSRSIEPAGASLEASGAALVVAGQLMARQRGGAVSSGGRLANPNDLRRENMLVRYNVGSGISSDPVITGDFKPEHVALSPGGCYAFFTSTFRDQARLHVWGLVEQGADFVRQDLPRPAVAVALDPAGRVVAAATDAGKVLTYRVSGATSGDCEEYSRRPSQSAAAAAGPTITLGSNTTPLFQPGATLRVAVLRFEGSAASADLGEGVAEIVSGELSNAQGIVVVERAAINSILKEMELQRSGLTTADAVRIGRGLNAKKIILGSVRRFGSDTFYLTVRVVDVETQGVDGQREVTCAQCREQDILTAAKELRKLLVR